MKYVDIPQKRIRFEMNVTIYRYDEMRIEEILLIPNYNEKFGNL